MNLAGRKFLGATFLQQNLLQKTFLVVEFFLAEVLVRILVCMHKIYVNDGYREMDEAWALFIMFWSFFWFVIKLRACSRNGRSKTASFGRKIEFACMKTSKTNCPVTPQVFPYATMTQPIE